MKRFLRLGSMNKRLSFADVRPTKRHPAGAVMIGALVALLIIAIFTPLIVNYVREEARWAVKQKRTTTAFHLAEAAVDRGIWKLTESDDNWNDIMDGTPIAGYDDDVEYEDITGGKYKIDIYSGPGPSEITVRGKGRDTSTNEMRAVEAVYSKSAINAGLNVEGGLQYKPNLHVHWGPVVTFSNITATPGDYYPRKYALGSISGRDTVDDSDNTDDLEYWAFHDLGDPPVVDLDYYKTQAKNSKIPTTSSSPDGRIERNTGGNTLAVASPTGSGYFLTSQNGNAGLRFEKSGGASNYYKFNNSTSVIYIDNDYAGSVITDLQNGGCFLRVEALIMAGSSHNMDCNAEEGVVSATVPAAAGDEYLHGSAPDPYPGEVTPGPGNCCYTLNDVAVHGFVYVGGNVANAGSSTQILGVLDVLGDVSVNTLYVYYDKEVADNIQVTGGSPTRVSWKEVKTTW